MIRIVKDIYEVLKDTERKAHITYPVLGKCTLPEDITFVTSEELEKKYPSLTAKERENIEAKDEHTDVIYGKVIPYIEKNLTESFSIDDIAKYVALNPQYMMRLFKKTTGKSVLTYITELRMEKAKELLIKTDCSIENITEKIGYFSVAHFSQLFKKIEGITPGKYRKNFR